MNVKLIGFGLYNYFRDSWCTFDFVVVWATIVSLLGSDLMPDELEDAMPNLPFDLKTLRVLRIAR